MGKSKEGQTIPDPGFWILDPGGTRRSHREFQTSGMIPLGLEMLWKNRVCAGKGGIPGIWGFGALGMCSHGLMLSSAFPESSLPSTPNPIPTFHKNQFLLQINFPGVSKISGIFFFFSGKSHSIQAYGWDREYRKPKKTLEFGSTAPSPLLLPPSPLLLMAEFPRLPS